MHIIVSQYFHVGPLEIRYYSITMVLGIIVAYFIGARRARRAGLEKSLFEDMFFWMLVAGFIGARFYYVLFYPQYFQGNWLTALEIWRGGISIYGGVLGGLLVLWGFARKIKWQFLKLTDIIAPALPLAQAIGRFGNFFNYEAFGNPTNLPWKMYVPLQFRPAAYAQYSYFQPTFLYEAIWDVLVFFFVLWLGKKTSRTGVLTAAYLLFYSIGRYFIEGLRLDSAFFGNFRGDQITAVLLMIAALIIMVRQYANRNAK